ncbi:hypothetical protein AZE42_07934 [Rhizopogon vesiculosus]|uniref:Uncharacterized protein n=1 Tax=Rhizopogon vesiculosus TaxID=180088 RepID=A0A1J8PWB8_9AGAM|nr:hypothetical protein AZE42_07934 [Rhizopogon vesiculosus]
MSTSNPAQTTVHRGFASTGPMPMSSNRMNSPCTPNISQFTVPPTHFLPHGYVTSSSSLDEGLPHRGQAVTQGQPSVSTSNYLSSPSNYPQINVAVPEMICNTMPWENINTLSYSGPVGTPDDSTQVTSPVTMCPPHAYPAPDPYHNSNGPPNTSYYHTMQGSTASWLSAVPTMGNNSQSSYSPSMQSSHIRTPDGSQQQWRSSANYYAPQADVLRSQPDVPTTFTSPPGRSRGDHVNHPSYWLLPQLFHGEGPHEGSMRNSSRSHTQESRTCCWLSEDNVPCGFEGPIDVLKAHFINNHLTGPQDAQFECLWDRRHYSRRGQPGVRTMRRDSMWRHVLEKHLHVKYRKKP